MIVINARFLTQSITGVQRFALEVCKRLPAQIDGMDLVFVGPKTTEFDNLGFNGMKTTWGILQGNLWEQLELPVYLKIKGNPLLVNLVGIGPIFYKNKIIALYDLAFKHHP